MFADKLRTAVARAAQAFMLSDAKDHVSHRVQHESRTWIQGFYAGPLFLDLNTYREAWLGWVR